MIMASTFQIPSTPRENRNNRGRMNGGIAQSAPHIPPLQQLTQYVATAKDSNNNQVLLFNV